MLATNIDLGEIYRLNEDYLAGPVRVIQLGQLWTWDPRAQATGGARARSSASPTPRTLQSSNGAHRAGHLAVLCTKATDANISLMRALPAPRWPDHKTALGCSSEMFRFSAQLPRDFVLTVVNTTRIHETWARFMDDHHNSWDVARTIANAALEERVARARDTWEQCSARLSELGVRPVAADLAPLDRRHPTVPGRIAFTIDDLLKLLVAAENRDRGKVSG